MQQYTITIHPNCFAFWNRYLSVLHDSIRNNCSNPNNDLSINHLRDNLLCNWCSEIEDGEHYFFNCNNYSNERHVLFEIARYVHPLNTNELLYGNYTLYNTLNSSLFRAVHYYTKSTKRFDNIWSYFLYLIRKFNFFLTHFMLYLIFFCLACSLWLVGRMTKRTLIWSIQSL